MLRVGCVVADELDDLVSTVAILTSPVALDSVPRFPQLRDTASYLQAARSLGKFFSAVPVHIT